MQNESVSILRIRGTNLYVYGEYTEWGKSLNEISLLIYWECICLYWEYTEWICSYTLNTRNGSVSVLRICRMHKKLNIFANSKPKLKIFWDIYQELRGVRLAKKSLKTKKSHASVPLRSSLKSHSKWITAYIHRYTVQYSVCIFTIVQVQLSLSGGRIHFPVSVGLTAEILSFSYFSPFSLASLSYYFIIILFFVLLISLYSYILCRDFVLPVPITFLRFFSKHHLKVIILSALFTVGIIVLFL
jgi:hypothetical protein